MSYVQRNAVIGLLSFTYARQYGKHSYKIVRIISCTGLKNTARPFVDLARPVYFKYFPGPARCKPSKLKPDPARLVYVTYAVYTTNFHYFIQTLRKRKFWIANVTSYRKANT